MKSRLVRLVSTPGRVQTSSSQCVCSLSWVSLVIQTPPICRLFIPSAYDVMAINGRQTGGVWFTRLVLGCVFLMCVVTVSLLLFLKASSPSPMYGGVHVSVSVCCQLCVVLYFAYIHMYAYLVQALWCCTQPCGDMLPLSTCTGVCISTVSYTEQNYQSRGEQFIKEVYLCACVHVGACVCMMHLNFWLEKPS